MKICTCTHRFPSLIYYRRRQAFVEWEREREREKEMWIRISRWGAWEEGWIRSSSLITVFKLIGTYNSHSTNACLLLLLLLFVRLPSPLLRIRLVCGFLLGLVGSMAMLRHRIRRRRLLPRADLMAAASLVGGSGGGGVSPPLSNPATTAPPCPLSTTVASILAPRRWRLL